MQLELVIVSVWKTGWCYFLFSSFEHTGIIMFEFYIIHLNTSGWYFSLRFQKHLSHCSAFSGCLKWISSISLNPPSHIPLNQSVQTLHRQQLRFRDLWSGSSSWMNGKMRVQDELEKTVSEIYFCRWRLSTFPLWKNVEHVQRLQLHLWTSTDFNPDTNISLYSLVSCPDAAHLIFPTCLIWLSGGKVEKPK